MFPAPFGGAAWFIVPTDEPFMSTERSLRPAVFAAYVPHTLTEYAPEYGRVKTPVPELYPQVSFDATKVFQSTGTVVELLFATDWFVLLLYRTDGICPATGYQSAPGVGELPPTYTVT